VDNKYHAYQAETVANIKTVYENVKDEDPIYASQFADAWAFEHRHLCKMTKIKLEHIAKERRVAHANGLEYTPEY